MFFFLKKILLLFQQTEDAQAYRRYMQKILDIGEDPFIYINKGAKTSGYSSQWRDLPQVTYRDIILYLVETHSFYTRQQIRAYKGTVRCVSICIQWMGNLSEIKEMH